MRSTDEPTDTFGKLPTAKAPAPKPTRKPAAKKAKAARKPALPKAPKPVAPSN